MNTHATSCYTALNHFLFQLRDQALMMIGQKSKTPAGTRCFVNTAPTNGYRRTSQNVPSSALMFCNSGCWSVEEKAEVKGVNFRWEWSASPFQPSRVESENVLKRPTSAVLLQTSTSGSDRDGEDTRTSALVSSSGLIAVSSRPLSHGHFYFTSKVAPKPE